MNFQQVRHPIDYVVQRIRSGRLALPDFQRDFVWSPSQVVDLLDSVAREWPIGSLLLLSGPQPFAFRAIDNAPATSGTELELYVLDGQQRVTAMYHAIANVSKYCYYVDFQELLDGGVDPIKWASRSIFDKKYPDLNSRARAGLALIKDIWDQPAFFSWLAEIRSEQLKDNFIQARETNLAGLQSKVYQIMAIELERGIELEALARIFETINRTGVALTAFDLLVAKLYPTKFNLREAWDQAKERYENLLRFDPNELEILKLISLLIRKNEGRQYSKGVRQGDLLALDPSLLVQYWEEAVDLYAAALDECKNFGITTSELVPSWSMILGVAGCLLYQVPGQTEAWWKDRLRRQVFAQAANTKIVAEFDSGMALEIVQDEIGEGTDPLNFLDKPARANGLLTKGLLGLFVARGAIDALTGEKIAASDQVAIRWVDQNGEIKKLTSDGPIGRAIVLSDASAKKLKKGIKITDLPYGGQASKSQGLEALEHARDADTVRQLFA
ncbi:DUF262 domain-containing protein [Variovorax sp. GB1R11]|uniref:DUF262 domain-containing protein n=1 Tax=Variovorax sp. GB1R11 TaxID=3443741 RepID=UPI003F4466FC